MVKLIVFDLDDTLAKLGKGIAPSNLSKLKTIEAKGITIAICSGKPTYYLCGFMRQAELKQPVLVGENGATIQIGVELPPKKYYTQDYPESAQHSMDLLRTHISEALPKIWYQPNIVGLTPFFDSDNERKVIQSIIDSLSNELKDVEIYPHVDSYDIIPAGINKKSGLSLLGQILQITPEETIAVGNESNDYPMFEYAGFSVGVNVPDVQKVNVNFKTPSEALDYIIRYIG